MYNDRSIGMEIKHTVLVHRFQYEKVDNGKQYKNSRFTNMLYFPQFIYPLSSNEQVAEYSPL
jgi:hypothetical protein